MEIKIKSKIMEQKEYKNQSQELIFRFFSLLREFVKILKTEELKKIEEELKKVIIQKWLDEFIEDRFDDVIILNQEKLSEIIENEEKKIMRSIWGSIMRYFTKIRNNKNKLEETINFLENILASPDYENLNSFISFCKIDSTQIEIKKDVEELLHVA